MIPMPANVRIELEAVRLGIEWKSLFADELKSVALQLAAGSEVVTVAHYRQAVPVAVASLLQAIELQSSESTDGQRQVA